MKAMKKYLAEFIGTFVLVLFACGAAGQICTKENAAAGLVGTALAFGLVIVAMAYSIGNVSGCHINPAVSIAMLVSRKMSFKDFIFYVIAQCLGAIAGAALLGVIFGFDCGFGANAVDPNKLWGGFLVEAVLTCIFVLAILGVTSRESFSKVAGLVIGASLTLVHLLGIGITGTGVNPARSLGPAIFKGGEALSQVWIFILAPLAGGIAAALIWMFLDKKDPMPKKSKKKK